MKRQYDPRTAALLSSPPVHMRTGKRLDALEEASQFMYNRENAFLGLIQNDGKKESGVGEIITCCCKDY